MKDIPGRNGGTLKRLEKGETANPKGRPKKLPELRALLDEVLGDVNGGMTAADAIFRRLRQKAVAGDIRASELLLGYAYGKPKQALEHTGKDGGEIQIKKTVIWELPPEPEKPE